MSSTLSVYTPALNAPRRRSRRRHKPSIVTLVGTAYLQLLEYLEVFPESIILACDVQSELEALRIRPIPCRHVITIPFGVSDTMQSLVSSQGTPRQLAAALSLPIISLSNGCSQLPVVGYLAMKRVLDRTQFRSLLRNQILPSLHAWSGGELGVLRHLHLQGASGGSGSLAGLEIVRELCSEVNASWGIPLKCEFHVVGAVSFQGPEFLRTRENAGCTIAEVVDLTKSVGSTNEILVYLHELAPVGIDKSLRDALAIEQLQAFMAPNVTEHVARTAPNYAPQGPLGHMTSVQTNHYRPLDQAIVAANIATAYLPQIVNLMSAQADLSLVNRLDLRRTETPRARESLERILERALETRPDEVIGAVTQPHSKIEYLPQVELNDGRMLDLSDVSSTFCQPIKSATACENRLILLLTCGQAVELALEEAELQVRDALDAIDESTTRAMRAIRDLRGELWFSWLRSTSRKIDCAESAFAQLRAASDYATDCRAKATALQLANRALNTESDGLQDRLRRMSNLLASCLPRGDSHRHLAAVTAKPLDEIFEELMAATSNGIPQSDFVHLVNQAAQFVTRWGLGEIVGASDSSIEAIFASIASGEHRTEGPMWGGEPRHDQPVRFLVFPPVSSDLETLVREHHANSHSPSMIAFAATGLGSINIVELALTHFTSASDLTVPFYRKGSEQAAASHLRDLIIRNEEALKRVGISLPDRPAP